MKNKCIQLYRTCTNNLGNLWLFIMAVAILFTCFSACEKNFDVKVKANQPQLVVEAYINNEMRAYNYVVLSRSLNYLSLDFQSTPVTDAMVTITEGERAGDSYNWDSASKVQLKPINVPGVPAELTNIYFDPRMIVDSAQALLGKPGKSYLLQISEGGNQYTAITSLLQPVPVDSLTLGYGYEDSNQYKLRITTNYQDPDTIGNSQMYFYRFSENRNSFGWASFYGSRSINLGTDELTNGQYIRLTHPRGFLVGDTVEYHMASVTRDVYKFWESFNNARNNGGPFATPVTLVSNISGEHVAGCFSGMSLSSKTIIITQ